MKILICNPNFKKSEIYLPYFWGRVKAYCEFNDDRDFSSVEFLPPIYAGGVQPHAYKEITDDIDFNSIDLLFLSCYVWNWHLQLKIAHEARRCNPNIVIIAGGPSAQYKPSQDVHLFSDCDYVTPGEGEKLSADIIFTMMEGGDLSQLSFLVDPAQPRDITVPRQNIQDYRSPYVEYREEYITMTKKIRQENPNAALVVLWETNRGCPYRCSFCDWGSVTNSKLKRFSSDTVSAEVEVICRDIQPNYVFNTDANFGIVKDDIKYAQLIADARAKYGAPSGGLYFSAAKNHKENVNSIMKILRDASLLPFAQISFQHTDLEVLEAIDRDNIKTENLADSMRESFELGMPMVATIILGNPGDTPDKWKDALNEMLETRFHDMRIHDFMVLPNAPAAQPDYMEKYGIKTIRRLHLAHEYGHLNPEWGRFEAEFISETRTFDKKDYINMQLDAATVLGYHVLNVTKFVSLYLRYFHQVSYMDFYYGLRTIPTIEKHTNELKVFIENWVEGRSLYKYAKWNDGTYSFDTFLKIRAIEDVEELMQDLLEHLVFEYGIEPSLAKDLITFQHRTIVGPWEQTEANINYNLPQIMSEIMHMHPLQKEIKTDLVRTPTRLFSNQTKVGNFNKRLRGIDITDINDMGSWVKSSIHAAHSLRTSVNYYHEILQ
jgi:putative methyltransferase